MRCLTTRPFSKNRHGRFRQSDTLRHVFESVLRRCMSEGLVGGEGFAIDASVIKADANRARGVPGSETTDWRKETTASWKSQLVGPTLYAGWPFSLRSSTSRSTPRPSRISSNSSH